MFVDGYKGAGPFIFHFGKWVVGLVDLIRINEIGDRVAGQFDVWVRGIFGVSCFCLVMNPDGSKAVPDAKGSFVGEHMDGVFFL